MTTPAEARHLSLSIACDAQRAYNLLWMPEAFLEWASGLAASERP